MAAASWYGEAVPAADDETLFSALAVIRAAPPANRADRALAPAWRTVSDWLAHRLPGRDKEDVRQEALVKVVRYVDSCEARGPSGAAAWLLRVAQHTAIDASRTAKVSPVDRALRERQGDEDPIESLAADRGDTVSADVLDVLTAELEDALDAALTVLHPAPLARVAPRAHARARLYRRLLRLSVADVKERLAWHTPLTDDLVSKWIERGQAPLDAALRHWVAEDPDGRASIGERLREEVGQRRHDAGRPRPTRRSRPDGAGRRPSVGPTSIRLVSRGIEGTSVGQRGGSRRAVPCPRSGVPWGLASGRRRFVKRRSKGRSR